MIKLLEKEQEDANIANIANTQAIYTHFSQIKSLQTQIKILIGESDIIQQNKEFLRNVLSPSGYIKNLSASDRETIQNMWYDYSRSVPKRQQKQIIDKYINQSGSGVDKDGISTKEIQSLMRKYDHKTIPVIPSDMINTISVGPLNKEIYFIMNLDPSSKPGSHWVAVAISNMDKSIMYYDSLCIHPTHTTLQALKRLAMKMDREHMFKFKFNTVRDQSKSSGKCGFFAIQFLHKIMNGKSFKQASMYDRNYTRGEHEIQKMMNRFGYI
jgi:hypothetical protein